MFSPFRCRVAAEGTTTSSRLTRAALLSVAALMAAGAAPALAQGPPNDDRSDATALPALPASVNGTTAGSTVETTEPNLSCSAQPSGSVWYEITAPAKARIVVRLAAAGKLDAVLDIYSRIRSQIAPVACDMTDSDGTAALSIDADGKSSYLIRVSQRENSVSGTFRLDAFVPTPPPAPPGPLLPSSGALRRIDPLSNPTDAWSAELREGVSYRVNLAHSPNSCVGLSIFGPGVRSFNSEATYVRPCGGYVLLTPGPGRSGRWSFLVDAREKRGVQSYRLQIGPAGPDDLTPGTVLGNYSTAYGLLEGGRLNKLDVYQFDVTNRSYVVIKMATKSKNGFDVQLLNQSGSRIRCACGELGSTEIRKGLRRGRYLIVVRARHRAHGTYRLTRTARTITAIRAAVNGRPRARVSHGSAVRISVKVRPAVAGPVSLIIDRFDPLSGWHFRRRIQTTVHAGRASSSFTPPTIGTWRVYAVFRGTRIASPSSSRHVRIRVTSPLKP